MIGCLQCLTREAHIEWIHARADVLGQQILRFTVEVLAPLFELLLGNGNAVGAPAIIHRWLD